MRKILLIAILIFAFGCSDDATEPSENTIVGKWMKNTTNEGEIDQSLIVLEFTEDKELFLNIEGLNIQTRDYQGTYSIKGDIIIFVGGNCGKVEGKYKLKFKDNGVELSLIEDECKEREYMIGFFEKDERLNLSYN